MWWNFINKIFVSVLLSFCLQSASFASPRVVQMNIREKNVSEAINAAIRLSVLRNLKENRSFLLSLIEAEVLPIASNFVLTYKINSSRSGAGFVNITADVDLDTLKILTSFNALEGQFKNKRALVLVQTPEAGAPWLGKARHDDDQGLYTMISSGLRSRLSRRGFELLPPITTYSDELASLRPEILRREFLATASKKLGVGLVVTVKTEFVVEKNKRGYNQRFLSFQTAIYNAEKNEVYKTEPRKILMNAGRAAYKYAKSDELIQSVLAEQFFAAFRDAGQSYVSYDDDSITVRIPDLARLRGINSVREVIENLRKVNSVREKRITWKDYEFAVDTSLTADQLRKMLAAQDTKDLGLKIQSLQVIDAKLLELRFAMLESNAEGMQATEDAGVKN